MAGRSCFASSVGQRVRFTRPKLLGSLHSLNPCRQLWTQHPRIGGLVGEATNRGKPLVYRSCRETARLQLNPIANDHNAIERQAWF